MAKHLIQVIIAGGKVVGSAFARAFRQEFEASQRAAQRHGGGKEGTKKAAADMSAGMSLQEAKEILNISDIHSEAEIKKHYEHLFEVNDKSKGGSFYLQSKVVRAKERVDIENKTQSAGEEPSSSNAESTRSSDQT